MKTPDENKCGLECIRTNVERVCVKPEKGQCPRCEQLMGETHERIRQLEADNSRKDDTIRNLTELLNAAHDETAAIKREMDALMLDFQLCVKRTRKVCSVCGNKGKQICNMCERCDVFEWRGVCPENVKEE